MTDDGEVTWDQLKRARMDIVQQIETLQRPLRAYGGNPPNVELIARWQTMLDEIDEQLAQWKHQE